MPDSEQLEKQLEAQRETKWLEKRLGRLSHAWSKHRNELRELLEPAKYRYDRKALSMRINRAKSYVGGLTARQRKKFWAELFPKLVPHLERAWFDAGRRPYQTDIIRLPFRAPHRKEMTDEHRARFLVHVCDAMHGLDPDIKWLAAWTAHLSHDWEYQRVLGWLLATALRSGGPDAESVRGILIDSINGEHEIGQMGTHCIVAMLNSDEPSDWEVIGKLLLAAQRQEGLRQAILETVDEANPRAFRYMLGLILEHDLARFSATVRAFDIWMGMRWAAGSTRVVNESIQRLVTYFDDETARRKAITEGSPEEADLALWVSAYEDAERALALAAPLLEEASPERRFIALRAIDRIALHPESLELIGSRLVSGAETDPRLLMATAAFLSRLEGIKVSEQLFNATANLFERTPKTRKKHPPLVWPWAEYAEDRRVVAEALRAMAQGSPERIIPYASALSSHHCVRIIQELAGIGEYWEGLENRKRKRLQLAPQARRLMLELAGDARQDVQKAAFEALEPLPVEQDEVETLLGLLHRSAPAMRSGAIGRLMKLADDRAIEIAGILIKDSNPRKCAAGLELAGHLVASGRSSEAALHFVREQYDSLNEPGLREAADRLLGGPVETVSFDDCFGLVPPGSRSALPVPQYVGVKIETDAAQACLRELAELFLRHGETEIELTRGDAKHRMLLASAGWAFPSPDWKKDPESDARERLPLCDVWLDWLRDRSAATREPDGLELLRAWVWRTRGESYLRSLPAPFREPFCRDLQNAFMGLLDWMLHLSAPNGGGRLLVQHFEDSLAKDCPSAEEEFEIKRDQTVADSTPGVRSRIVGTYLRARPADVSPDCQRRYCLLRMLALQRRIKDCDSGPSLDEFTLAYDAGLLNEHDFVWCLLTPRDRNTRWGPYFGPIEDVSGLRESKQLAGRPKLLEAAARMRARLVELELARGERPTPASLPARKLRHSGGADVLFSLVTALGRDKLVRHNEWGEPTRAYALSRLIAVSAPAAGDTYERFAQLVAESDIKPARLLEVAMYAPLWAGHAQHALNMSGLEDTVWWIHAHTKQNSYWREREFREMWAARVSERTSLEADELEDGAVDVAWFRRVLEVIGEDGWDLLQKPAKYACNSGGHKRAQLFADAMLSRVAVADLVPRIEAKRHQDSVRALGLVPLPEEPDERRSETLRRYTVLQEFKRASRKFGSQRQASEGRAVEIGMENLARTAGYRDPQRLQWAMEAVAVADLARGPVVVSVDETTVSLAITEEGDPELTVVKDGRPLKSVPAKLRKNERIAELRGRTTELRRQKSRMRRSLEEAMCRGDEFSAVELREFFAHPMLRTMVGRLVLIGAGELIGYPEKDGRILRNWNGTLEPVGRKESVRIAHPVDLLGRGDWSDWQRECFAAERVQPFKQLFREAYPKTAAELDACDFSRRYAGHQVNPRQALSLLKQRQWVAAPEEGVRKTFHAEGLIAELWFQEHFFTPADVEGLTLEGVVFVRRRVEKYERVLMADVPDRLFSEVMRDLDLVVSVAHAGGVDPEASASTVEMRATLVGETCRLLNLSNVRVDGHHVKIDGKLGSYSVHLGSASTKVLPGRMLLIVTVHSQYRGRLFLPFADDDPKTAEVLSKTLLLARDEEIKDPSILDQIRG